MGAWSTTTKHEPDEINGGNQYSVNDQISIEQLNAITENALYAMAKADNAVALLGEIEALLSEV